MTKHMQVCEIGGSGEGRGSTSSHQQQLIVQKMVHFGSLENIKERLLFIKRPCTLWTCHIHGKSKAYVYLFNGQINIFQGGNSGTVNKIRKYVNLHNFNI